MGGEHEVFFGSQMTFRFVLNAHLGNVFLCMYA